MFILIANCVLPFQKGLRCQLHITEFKNGGTNLSVLERTKNCESGQV